MFTRDIIGSLDEWRRNTERKPQTLLAARQRGTTAESVLLNLHLDQAINLRLSRYGSLI